MRIPHRRSLAAACVFTSLVAVAQCLHASETVPIKTSPRKSPVTDSATLAVDPMDKLRERLAAKLGANAQAGTSPNVLQVAVRPGAAGASATPETRNMAEGRGAGAAYVPLRSGKGAAAHSVPARKPEWSYEGAGGPEQWGQLRPEFSQCSSGTRQSPIDIRDGISVQLDPIQFDYQASSFGVIDTGRTVQVNVAPGNSIEVMGRKFDLVRMDFQHPSEERIEGRQFDMGVHLVHQDGQGRTAVVAVLMDRGASQPVIQTVWNNLPLEKGEELPARASIDLMHLLPSDRRYFTYMGSMTTPPCKEGVLWMVMKSPIAISSEQLAVFSRLYRMNARPVQSAGGRLIKGP